ncbi:uncharacterized protein LOC133544984 isoform X5 [Nerophis ophidion]|uniref:uncharacterized protein LOC133544984 isoform X5 n=1 Tax=Nerophis ophidion TaxID=159077 RepID=UPI002AE0683C|nr:uncharacterized protein LOC133544984 isoform X5 [Nerophis ophidion]
MCETTVAEYEEELSPTIEEKERRHQLLDAVFKKHQVVLHRTVAPTQPREFSSKRIQDSSESPVHRKPSQAEADQQHRDVPNRYRRAVHPGSRLWIASTSSMVIGVHVNQFMTSSSPPHIKEEEAECRITLEGECLLGQEEADLSKFPLTVVSVKTEEHEDKPPESSQLHHSPSEVFFPGKTTRCPKQPELSIHLQTQLNKMAS